MKRIINYRRKLLLLIVITAGATAGTQAQVVVTRRPAAVTVVRTPVTRVYYPARRVVVAPRPVVVAPIYRPGIVIASLPAYYGIAWVGRVPYYYSGGVFYVKTEGTESYKVVLPPQGTIVPALPDGSVKTMIDGKPYYEFQGIIYKEVIIDNSIKYEVSGYTILRRNNTISLTGYLSQLERIRKI